jgi:hypothetical protein
MRKHLILTTLFICIFTFLPVGTTKAAYNWSGNVRIASIEVSNVNAAGVWLSFTSDPYSSHTCSAKNGQYKLGGGVDNVNKMMSVATDALVQSRNVSIYWGGGCSGGGTNGYPIMIGLTLK